jgi:hypothetical protein
MRLLLLPLLALCLFGCPPIDPDEPTVTEPCGRRDLGFAPPARDEAGVGLIAAVDIDRIEVDAVVDVAAERIDFVALLDFAVGEDEGLPVLQFLLEPDSFVLDGEAIGGQLTRMTVSEPPRSLLVLPDVLAPCSEHSLEVAWSVVPGDVEPATLPHLRFAEDAAWWSSAQEDGSPDAMLEVWMPSNLIFDRFDLALDVQLVGSDQPHDLVANAPVEELGDGHWSVEFEDKQAHGPFWVLHRTDGVDVLEHVVDLPGGRQVTVELRAFTDDDGVDLAASAAVAELSLLLYDEHLGPYLHGDRYLAWLRSDMSVSMEYDGATLSSPDALQHEMAHSWWARGVAPVSDHHGWMDEGVALWGTGGNPFVPVEVETGTAGARLLTGDDEWAGASLGTIHYVQGAVVLGGIAGRVGSENLMATLRAFYDLHAPGPVSTEQLERALYCALGDPYVLDIFHNRVRGLDGWAEIPEEDFCEGHELP